ncbi:MAG: hypothetical protein QOF44_5872, partial [Streptomyces sp.]|nr:hypothetical protein [Streptomyces sp.]
MATLTYLLDPEPTPALLDQLTD